MDRLKEWWWVLGAVCFLAGLIGGLFIKFNIYYLAEQASVTTLLALSTSSQSTVLRLDKIDERLRDQNYLNKDVAKALLELATHVHALDERADRDRDKITDALSQQDKNTKQILLILEPKPKSK